MNKKDNETTSAAEKKSIIASKNKDFDFFIGKKMKSMRLLLGFTQSSFSKIMGVTFQQVQKYEKGVNRVSASMLWKLANDLGVNIDYFFNDKSINSNPNQNLSLSEKHQEFNLNIQDYPKNKETVVLMKNFHKIKDQAVKKRVLSLVQSLANSNEKDF